jgi:hypothetical protein
MKSGWNNIRFDDLANRVESRIDEIFGNAFLGLERRNRVDHATMTGHLESMNKILLSVKLNDPDIPMVDFFKQLVDLKKLYIDDKTILILIGLQKKLCIYIKSHRADAHPLALKLLRSIFNNMCNIISARSTDDVNKEAITNRAIQRFSKFHEILRNQRHSAKPKPAVISPRKEEPLSGYLKASNHQRVQIHTKESVEMKLFFESVVTDIKVFIRNELQTLKAELQAGLINK